MDTLELVMNEGENSAGRFAVLELGNERMGKEITLCALFVGLQGVIEN